MLVGCILVCAAKNNIISNPVRIEPYQRLTGNMFSANNHSIRSWHSTKDISEPQLVSLPNEKPLKKPNFFAHFTSAHFNFTHEIKKIIMATYFKEKYNIFVCGGYFLQHMENINKAN